jgi:hypothetical protein
VQDGVHTSPSAKAEVELRAVKEVKPKTAVATRVVERRIDLSIGFRLNYDLANYITSELSLIYSRAAPECHQSKNSKSSFQEVLIVVFNGWKRLWQKKCLVAMNFLEHQFSKMADKFFRVDGQDFGQ